jgi:hypothetical protein
LGSKLPIQNDYFTKTILGPNRKVTLGQPLNLSRPGVAYANGVKRLPRAKWLADPLRDELLRQIDIPPSFARFEDVAAKRTRTTQRTWLIGFWVAVLALVIVLGGIWLVGQAGTTADTASVNHGTWVSL